ncbi:MAG: sensor domain-containing phosphodiesterase [Trueperaceae bacterium]
MPTRTPAGAATTRLDALHRLQILDSDYEPPFDRIVRMAADAFDVPNVGIHLLDDERQWAKAFVGQRFVCPRDESVCQFTLEHDGLLVIPDLREDARTRDLAIVTGPPRIRFYAGMPLVTRDGHAVGTLCLIDMEPRAPLDAAGERSLREFAALVTETMELRVDYHRTQQSLQRAIEFDAVTGLRNRAEVLRSGQRLLDEKTPPVGIAVVKVQLDLMDKVVRVGGQEGHMAVLRQAADRLRQLLGPEDQLGRGDGDSFLVLRVRQQRAGGRQLEAWLDDTAARILDQLARPMLVSGKQVSITASLGLARFDDGSPANHAADAAAAAAFASQKQGGNRALRFSFEKFAAYRDRVGLEAELRTAIAESSFDLHYQPIVDMAAEGRVVGAEALVRWPRDDGRAIGPDRFIPLAEEVGLIHELGLWVFRTACRDLAAWQAQGWRHWVSVNLSPVQLTDPSLVRKLVEHADAAGVACRDVKLEITEGALATDVDDVGAKLEALSAAGFRLALDDFGTGHSSMARVIRLPFDTLKVDRGFVSDCPDGPGAAVVIAMSGLARHVSMDVVAEGVETERHERFLRDHGYTFGQGYRYARPMAADALRDHLEAAGATASVSSGPAPHRP